MISFIRIGLQEKGYIESIHFAVNWWMTLFTGTTGMPFEIVLRTMDTFLFERQKILYRVSLAIIKIKEKELLALNGMDRLLPFLTKAFQGPIWEDDDAFFKVAFSIKLSRKDIDVRQLDYLSHNLS